MTPRELAEEGLRERLLEAVLAHTGVQPGWPHYDAGRVVVLVLDAIEPAIEAEFKAQAKEFRRLAAEALERQRRLPRKFVKDRYEYLGMAHAYKDAARRLEEEI
jgi:hypothetical protein